MTVRDLHLNADGDIHLDGADLALVADGPAVTQAVQIGLSFFQEEWFLDLTAGLPWFQDILVKNPNLAAIRAVIRERLLTRVGVDDVLFLDLDYTASTRTLAVSFRVSTALGELSNRVEVVI